ncbi:hypothetical protein [Nibrella viscosa]|uniref:hypothetical protein n=1 Tax=Nibrella viscosa TaxID=1084524 RepID=UPI0031ED5CDC
MDRRHFLNAAGQSGLAVASGVVRCTPIRGWSGVSTNGTNTQSAGVTHQTASVYGQVRNLAVEQVFNLPGYLHYQGMVC